MKILVPVPVCRQFRPGDPGVMVLSMKFVTLCRPGNTLIGPHAWGRDEGFKILSRLKSQEWAIIRDDFDFMEEVLVIGGK